MNLKMQRRVKCFKSPLFVVFTLFFLFTLLQFLAPLSIPKNTLTDLSGYVALADNTEIIDQLNFPSKVIYSIGDRLCHQKPERSLFINGNQMPFCSRCTAIWVGIILGLVIELLLIIQLNEKILLYILLSLVPIGIDGTGQLLGLWESTNIVRIITGLLIGIASGVAIGIIIDEISSLNPFNKISKSN